MKTRRLLLLLSAALLLPVAGKAQTVFSVDGVTYTVTGAATVAAMGGATTLTTLTIPETVTHQGKTYTVTHIGARAFQDCPLTEVTLPSTLLSFGSVPFNGAGGLTITCYAVQAPQCTVSYGAIASNRDKCTLRVPAIAFDDYTKSAWNDYSQYDGYAFQKTEFLDYEPKTVYVHSDFSFSRVPYSSPDVRMLLSPGTGQLTVDQPMSFGNFSMQADLRYRGNAQNTLVCNNKVTASAVELTIQLYASLWNFFMLPFDVDAGAISPDGSGRTYIRRYDSEARADGRMNETWVDVEPGETLHAYQGYILYNRSSADLAMTIQAPGDGGIFMARTVSTPLQQYPSEYAQDANWNFLGNPYPCYYDVRALGITNPITVREYNSYYSVSPLDDDYVLSPFQAFFIQSEGGMGSLSFPLEGRSHSSRGVSMARQRQLARAQAAGRREVLNILLESSQRDFADRTRIVINEAAAAGYELSRDAAKFFDAASGVQQVYTVADGTCYAINERPQGDGTATLGMTIAEDGEYTLRMQTQSALPVTLVDHETGLRQSLNSGDSYTFTAEAGTFSDRFTLYIGNATGISQVATEAPAATQQPLYNLSGQRVSAAYKGFVVRGGKKIMNQ